MKSRTEYLRKENLKAVRAEVANFQGDWQEAAKALTILDFKNLGRHAR
jgi:hypothetical protein